ncbi:ABC transporter ATP-binding protein/permease [Brevibacterium oceani]|uniref:ABC transporter ATP-binding protein/permease n=1 Tax=Brevibacterium oceani TaxID=358099 RepID=UPI0015E7D985|nr:ABC transporter ATP-binding protein/permease [Brevibacterium oceani]
MAKRGFNGAIMSAFGLRDHEAEVIEVERLAPKFIRVRMTSPTVFTDAELGPTAWLRFWFPDPADPDFEHQRGYTITEADPDAGTFAVDFVLHEPAGPASAWAESVSAGDRVEVASMGSTVFTVPDELPAGYLLIGDSASIPAINSILEAVPAEVPVEVYLEEHEATDRLIPLADHPRAAVRWVPRRGESSLAADIESRDWSDWRVWTAPESGSLKAIRARLKDDFGFPKSEITARAYWYEGRAFGKMRGEKKDDTPAEAAEQTPAAPKGSWRANAGGRLIAPLKATLWIAGILQAIVTLVELAPYVLLVELSRQLLTGAGSATLWATGIWAVVLMGSGVVLSAALLFWLHLVDARFERDLRRRLLTTMARLPLGWFVDRGSGRIKQLVQDDTLALHYLVTHAVSDAVQAVVAPVAVLVYLFIVDWRIALALLVPVLVYVVTMYIMLIQSGTKPKQALTWAEQMNVEAGSYLAGQPVIRVFGGAAASRFRSRLDEYVRFLTDWQRPFTTFKTVMDLVNRPATYLLIIAALGTWLTVSGSIDPIDLLPFLFLGTTFGARLLGIGYGLSGLSTGLLAARRIQNTLDEEELEVVHPHEKDTPASAREASPAPGLVEFDDVGFAYRVGVPVIDGVSLRLEPGTVTALVGPSGSGKSTLAALLARFHDVTEGAVRIGGRDLRTLPGDELYTRVGFVFQDIQLVHGTVAENIALAVPEASEDAIIAAARQAQIHDRILRLPDGYDTVIGAEAALSGGERQRLAIARAILADTPVLVLDEATAFADPESEHLVQQALGRLAVGRTVLVIAHRLHTITDVDRIVVLDHGRVAESGTHTDLIAADGRYRKLWDARETTPAPTSATAPRTQGAAR